MDRKERRTLERVVIPRMEQQLKRIASAADAPTTFDNGGPGMGNPAATMKYHLGLLPDDRVAPDSGYESTPDFAFRHLKSTLYYDGGYTVPGRPKEMEMTPADATDVHLRELGGVTSIFTVAVMGLSLSEASRNADGTLGYPSGYVPWSTPAVYDTRRPGRSNSGHTRPFARLSEADKAALLEYMKRF